VLLLFTILLIFIILSRIIETSTKIPSTLTLIIFSFVLSYFFPHILNVSNESFDEILYLMLPVILLPDILNISSNELKKHYKEIIYLAFIAVIFSIFVAVLVTPYLLTSYSFTIGMLLALFSMLMATDAITVASIMSKFKLPEKLKIYAESESLFNDVTALIIYYFIALPMISNGDINILELNTTLFKVLIFSTSIGVIIAYIGYFTIKILKNSFDQFLVIYLIVIISFMLAEHFNIAGILSIVTSVLTFKYLISKDLSQNKIHNISSYFNESEPSLLSLLKDIPALTKKNFREYKKESEFIGIFANAIVFMILANIINIDLLLLYYKEIIIIFLITSVIRYIAIYIMIKKLSLPMRWSFSLSLSGTKGALAIIMVHSLPDTFIYKEIFEAIIIGNVLLSTFIYTICLMFHINMYSTEYKQDVKEEGEHINPKITKKNLIDLIEKDFTTGAYTQTFIQEKIEQEIQRARRYKTEFSCILIDTNENNKNINTLKILGDIIKKTIRTNDIFGINNDNKLIILAANTSLSGALILSQKINNEFLSKIDKNIKLFLGISQISNDENYEILEEKLAEALNKSKRTTNNIQIEA